MQLFYTENIHGDYAEFDEVEARHAVQVLRKKVGDSLTFVDGKGGWYDSEVVETGKKKLIVKINKSHANFNPPKIKIHVAIAPTKNIDRFEWFLEKATEMGISSVTPLLCEHSERKRIRPDRLEKILLSAMKQSLKAYLPKLNELTDFQSFIENHETTKDEQRFIAHCQVENLTHLKNNCEAGKDVLLLIGPEGDFSKSEIETALAKKYKAVSLGKSRLRTETAGMVGVSLVHFLNA